MRVALLVVLLASGSSHAAQAVPGFDVRSLLDRARELAVENSLPPLTGTDQGVFEHVFKSYPKEAGACPDSARKLAADFAAATRLETLGALCVDQTEAGFDISVRYRASEALPAVTTAHEGGVHSGAGYDSKAACQGALGAEKERFERLTGLKAVVAYCFQDKFAREGEWTMRVEGLGQTSVQPRLSGVYVFGRVLGFTKEAFLAQVKSGIEKLGHEVSFVVLRPQVPYSELSALYYGQQRLRLTGVEYAQLQTAEQCAEQLAAARAGIKSGGVLISYCESMSVGMPFEVTALTAGQGPKPTTTFEDHATYAACMGARERLAQYHRDQGQTVSAALCGRAKSAWRVILLD